MENRSVLIVGAGALGMVMGYHLRLGGTAVTFYVRPSRLAAMQAPQRLYCYDDNSLKEFSEYRAIATTAEIAAQRYDYVLLTLDGAGCRSEEGTSLLRELGEAIRPSSARLIICGVGIGLREHIRQATGLPEERLMEGTLGCLSHQTQGANLPLHAPTDPARLSQAVMAYRHFSNKVGFNLAARPAAAAKEFAALYDQCGISRCSVLNPTLYNIVGNAFFPLTATCELAGWPNADGLAANKPLLSLCVKATKDIIGLRQHGLIGKLLSLVVSKSMLIKMVRKLEQDALPLDLHGFNRFHHGNKVVKQDVQVMRNCLAAGLSEGRPMTALKELLQAFEAKSAALR